MLSIFHSPPNAEVMNRIGFLVPLLILCASVNVKCEGCIPRKYNHSSIVCVCNATHCDTLPRVQAPKFGKYIIYTSSQDGLRFHSTVGSFGPNIWSERVPHQVDFKSEFQEIRGFGGAFTDSAGINILSLSKRAQNQLIRSYFSQDGLEYTMGRVPIGGTDFSTRGYTYQDNSTDSSLKDFNLTEDDFKYKIPIIKRAMLLSKNPINLIGSCWSPPKWMKTNNELAGFGELKEEYYKAYAKYHIKFLQAYRKEGINFWCVTTGNEPTFGFWLEQKINVVGFTPTMQGKWIGQHFGPAMRASFPDVCILVGDDQRNVLPWWLTTVMADKEAAKYVNGTAVHWYADYEKIPSVLPIVLSNTHEAYPELFLLSTEACNGFIPDEPHVALGLWSGAEAYAHDIIEDLNHWVVGWIEWNIALDEQGGPNYIGNFVDAPIIVNKTSDEFYKQPSYYALGHFSKFLPPGSRVIQSTNNQANNLEILSARRPDESIAVIILNKESDDVKFTLFNGEYSAVINIPGNSINSILFKEKN